MFSIKKLWSSSFTSSRTYIGFWLYGDYWVMHLKDWFFSNKIALENYGIKQTPTDSNAGGALLYIISLVSLAPWCSGYYCCTNPFNKAWTQVLHKFKSCSRYVEDSRWWGSATMVTAGNMAEHLSLVSHTRKATHHHHHHHHHHWYKIWKYLKLCYASIIKLNQFM